MIDGITSYSEREGLGALAPEHDSLEPIQVIHEHELELPSLATVAPQFKKLLHSARTSSIRIEWEPQQVTADAQESSLESKRTVKGPCLYYISASNYAELQMSDDEKANGIVVRSRLERIITKRFDPAFKAAFGARFNEIVEVTDRAKGIRLLLKPSFVFKAEEDETIDLYKFHHWRMKPKSEQSEDLAESDIVVLRKCYVFFRNQSAVIIDLSPERSIGKLLSNIIKDSEHNEELNVALHNPVMVLQELYKKVLKNQDTTVHAIEKSIEALNVPEDLIPSELAEFKTYVAKVSTQQRELGTAFSRLVEHEDTVEQNAAAFVRLLKHSPIVDARWAKIAIRNLTESLRLFRSGIKEARIDLETLDKTMLGHDRKITDSERLLTQIEELKQGERANEVTYAIGRANVALTKSNLFFQSGILATSVVAAAGAVIIGSEAFISEPFKTLGTRIIIGAISFGLFGTIAQIIHLKAAREVNALKSIIDGLESKTLLEHNSSD